MKIIPLTLLVLLTLSTGCLPPPQASTTPNAEIAQLREENARLRNFAVAESAKSPVARTLTTPAMTSPVRNGRYAVVSEVIRGEKPAYVCVTGTDPRHVMKGRKVRLFNFVCNGGYDSGLNCKDDDGDGFADYDSALSFEIEDKTVVSGSQGVLMPKQTCYVDVGRSRRIKLTVKRHAVLNTRSHPVVDLVTVDNSYTVWIDIEGNVTRHTVSENGPWSH